MLYGLIGVSVGVLGLLVLCVYTERLALSCARALDAERQTSRQLRKAATELAVNLRASGMPLDMSAEHLVNVALGWCPNTTDGRHRFQAHTPGRCTACHVSALAANEGIVPRKEHS